MSVQCRQNSSITKKVNALFHVPYWVTVLNDYSVQAAVVITKWERFVFLGCKHDGGRPFCSGRIDNIHRQHLVNFVFLKVFAHGQAWYNAEWIRRSLAEVRSF